MPQTVSYGRYVHEGRHSHIQGPGSDSERSQGKDEADKGTKPVLLSKLRQTKKSPDCESAASLRRGSEFLEV